MTDEETKNDETPEEPEEGSAEEGTEDENDTEEEQEPESGAEAATEELVKRKGIYKVELTIFYEDGWEQTMKTPPLFKIGPVEDMPLQLPPGMQATAKYYSASEIAKTVDLLEGLIEDLKNTLPTLEEVEEAKRRAIEKSADMTRKAALMSGAQAGQVPTNPRTGQPLQFPPGRPPGR